MSNYPSRAPLLWNFNDMLDTPSARCRNIIWTLSGTLRPTSPQRRWRNLSESHVEKYRKRSFRAPLGSWWGSLSSMAGPFVSSVVPLGDSFGVLWNPLESSGAASGIILDSLGRLLGVYYSGVLVVVLWDSYGDQMGTKWVPQGTNLGQSGDRIESLW